jgi:hypothetical protein
MDASSSGRSRRSGSGAGKSFLTAAAILIAIGGGVATFWYNPSLRAPTPKPVPDHTPDWMMTVPSEVPLISTPAKQNSTIPPAVVADANPSQTNSSNKSTGNSTASQTNRVPLQSSLIPAAPPPSNPAPAPSPAPVEKQTPAPQPPPLHVSDTPITTTTPPDPRITSASDVVSKLRQADAGDLDQLAMDLRSDGLDAEHRQDYFSAQYFYQQVESLSRDHWPQDIEQRLKDVQHRLSSSDAGQ